MTETLASTPRASQWPSSTSTTVTSLSGLPSPIRFDVRNHPLFQRFDDLQLAFTHTFEDALWHKFHQIRPSLALLWRMPAGPGCTHLTLGANAGP
jgi:hypothetical protein